LQRYEKQMKKPQLSPKDILRNGYLGKIWKNKEWIGEILGGLVAQKEPFSDKFTWLWIYLQSLSFIVVRWVPSWPLVSRSRKCNQFIDSILEDRWFSLFLYL
jgi:hypothetical protein